MSVSCNLVVTFGKGCPGSSVVRYLIVSIPDLCILSYFDLLHCGKVNENVGPLYPCKQSSCIPSPIVFLKIFLLKDIYTLLYSVFN